MKPTKKQMLDQNLDAYEKDIENNLDIRKHLSKKEKALEISKLKSAAKKNNSKIK